MKNIHLIIVFLAIAFSVNFAQIVVVANKAISEDIKNPSELYNVVTLERVKWKSGEDIAIFYNNSDAEINEKFFQSLGIKFIDAKKIWMKKTLTGEAKAPKTISSYEEILKIVSETKGAIAIVPKDKVKGDVKILFEVN